MTSAMSKAANRPEPVRVALAGETATEALAASLAAVARSGDILALWGDLGSGKTVFARAFIRAATGHRDEEVPSPTFTLVQTYETEDMPIHHFDMYRLKVPEEAYALGIEEAFADGISLIEWPDRLGGLLPRERLDIRLEHGSDSTFRTASLSGTGDWVERLKEVHIV